MASIRVSKVYTLFKSRHCKKNKKTKRKAEHTVYQNSTERERELQISISRDKDLTLQNEPAIWDTLSNPNIKQMFVLDTKCSFELFGKQTIALNLMRHHQCTWRAWILAIKPTILYKHQLPQRAPLVHRRACMSVCVCVYECVPMCTLESTLSCVCVCVCVYEYACVCVSVCVDYNTFFLWQMAMKRLHPIGRGFGRTGL